MKKCIAFLTAAVLCISAVIPPALAEESVVQDDISITEEADELLLSDMPEVSAADDTAQDVFAEDTEDLFEDYLSEDESALTAEDTEVFDEPAYELSDMFFEEPPVIPEEGSDETFDEGFGEEPLSDGEAVYEEEPATEGKDELAAVYDSITLTDGGKVKGDMADALDRTLFGARESGCVDGRYPDSETNKFEFDLNKDGKWDLLVRWGWEDSKYTYSVTLEGGLLPSMMNMDTDADGANDSFAFNVADYPTLVEYLEELPHINTIIIPLPVWTITINPDGGYWTDDNSFTPRTFDLPNGSTISSMPWFKELKNNLNSYGIEKMDGGKLYGCSGFSQYSSASHPDGYITITPLESSTTIYPFYKPIYTVTIKAGEGDAHFVDGTTAKTFKVLSGEHVTSCKEFPDFMMDYSNNYGLVREGYLFRGLFRESYSFPENLSSSIYADTELTARWGKEIHLTLYANGGTLSEEKALDIYGSLADVINPKKGIASGSVCAGEWYYLNALFSREGYDFDTFVTDPADPEGTRVEPDSYHRYLLSETEDSVTWYALWKPSEDLTLNNITVNGANISLWSDQSYPLLPGEALNLHVFAAGKNLTYQWESYSGPKDNPSAADYTSIDGAVFAAYETPAMTEEMEQTFYRCIISDAGGYSKTTHNIIVRPIYGILEYCPDCYCRADDMAVFQVKASGKGAEYSWTAQDNKGNDKNIIEIPGITGINEAVLKFPAAAEMDGWRFKCEVKFPDKPGDASSGVLHIVNSCIENVEITVPVKPAHGIKTADTAVTIPAGQGYSFDPDNTYDYLRKTGKPVRYFGEGFPTEKVRTLDRGWYVYMLGILRDNTDSGFSPELTKITVNGPQPDEILTEIRGSYMVCCLYYYVVDEISDADITMPSESFEYTGAAITPEPVLTMDGMILQKGKDYTLSYSNNENVGTASITINGAGDIPGSVTQTFEITKASLTGASVTGGNIIYNGTAQEPQFNVVKSDRILKQGTDFTVSGYENNINSGSASAVLTGIGNYTGTLTQSYTISPLQLTKDIISLPDQLYSGSALTPPPVIEADGGQLKEGVDYTVKYQNNVNAGTASAVITGIANCTGTVTQQFAIAKAYDTITAKNLALSTKLKKKQRVKLGASTIGGKLTYASSNKQIKVTKAGKLTIPKGFVGKTTITLTSAATDNCRECVKKITVTVNPETAKLGKVKNNAKGKVSVKWKKNAGNKVTGFEISVADNAEFENARSLKAKGSATLTKIIPKMIKGKTYYIRVRSYQKAEGKTYYSEWSKVKQVTIKK